MPELEQPNVDEHSGAEVEGLPEQLTALQVVEKLDSKFPLIERERGCCAGQPKLKGTRFRVTDVLCAVAQYGDIERAIHQWDGPYTAESWKEALYYAASYLEETVPLQHGAPWD